LGGGGYRADKATKEERHRAVRHQRVPRHGGPALTFGNRLGSTLDGMFELFNPGDLYSIYHKPQQQPRPPKENSSNLQPQTPKLQASNPTACRSSPACAPIPPPCPSQSVKSVPETATPPPHYQLPGHCRHPFVVRCVALTMLILTAPFVTSELISHF